MATTRAKGKRDISFTEKKPEGGRPYLYSMTKTVTLEPLYSVAFGPLSFSLLSACDSIGNNEFRLAWRRPADRTDHESRFTLPNGQTRSINGFAWSVAEISPAKKPQLPIFWFKESDPGPFSGLPDYRYSNAAPLTLRKSRVVRTSVIEATKQCTGLVQYSVQSSLRVYSSL